MADMEQSRLLIGNMMNGASQEICLLAAQGHGFAQVFRFESQAAHERGIQLRALLHRADATAAKSSEEYAWAAEAARMLTQNGWSVRSMATAPSTTCLIIDNAAVMEVPTGNRLHPTGLSLVDDWSTVRMLRDHFNRGWSDAVEVLFEDLIESSSPRSAAIIATIAETTWSSLIERLAAHPRALTELTSRKFEELVAELLTRDGFDVHITPQTRDGGRDILAHLTSPAGRHLFYVECKKYNKRPVGVEVVRGLYGTVTKDKVTAGLIVTTSTYTRDALKFAREIENQMSLKDQAALVQWLKRPRNAG